MSLAQLSRYGLGACFALAVLLLVMGWQNYQSWNAHREQLAELIDITGRVDGLYDASEEILFTQTSVAQWSRYDQRARELKNRLERFASVDPAARDAAEAVDRMHSLVATSASETAEERGLHHEAADVPPPLARPFPGRDRVERLTTLDKALERANTELLNNRRRAIEHDVAWMALTFAAAGALLALVSLALLSIFHRRIIRPLETMRTTVAEIRAGEPDARMPVHSADEVGTLGHAINELLDAQATHFAWLDQQCAEIERHQHLLSEAERIAGIGSWRLDIASKRLEWSDQIFHILAEPPQSFTPSIAALHRYVHPDDRERLAQHERDAARGLHAHEIEFRILASDGAERWIYEHAELEYGDDGQPAYLTGVAHDITERRYAEHRLRQYQLLVESGDELISVCDSAYRYVLVNRAYAAWHGHTQETIEGLAVPDVVGQRHFDEVIRPHAERCLAGESQSLEMERTDSRGQTRLLLARIYPVDAPDGSDRYIAAALSDITEHKRTQAALEEQSNLLAIGGRIAGFGGWALDVDTGQVTWSDTVADILEGPRGDATTLDEALQRLLESDAQRVRALLERCIERGEPYDTEVRIVTGDGDQRWLRVAGEPARFEDGRTVRVQGALQDITTYKRAESELREQSHLLAIAGRTARFGGWSVDLVQGVITWSDMVAEIHGMPAGYSPSVDEDGIGFFVPEHRDRIRAAFRACTEAGEPFDEELQIIDATGRRLWVRAIAEAVYDDDGAIVAVHGAFQDIDASKRREERLADYRALIENSSELFAIGDADYRYTLVNEAYARLQGTTSEELVGRPMHEVVGERNFTEYVRPHYDRALAGERVQFEMVHEDPKRGARHILAHYEPIDSVTGADRHVGAVMTDITALKEAETELQHLNEHLANVLESITDAFLTVDRDWIFQYVNAEAGRIMGRDPQDLVGRNAWAEFSEGVGTAFEDAFTRAMDRREPMSVEEYYAPLGMWLDVRVYPTDAGLALYFRDVTERRRTLEQLREQDEALRHNRNELAQALETRQALINSLPANIALLDAEGNVIDVNGRWIAFGRENEGADPSQQIGVNYLAICETADGPCAEEAPETADGLRRILGGERERFWLEYPCHGPEEYRWYRLEAARLAGESSGGEGGGAVVMHVDITERKLAERELNRLAYEDALTRLPSRNGFIRDVAAWLGRDEPQAGATVAALDLTRMRDYNDTHGYATGDALLTEVGRRLEAAVGEYGVVARIGGDEFAIFVAARADQAPQDQRSALAESLAEPFPTDGVRVDVEARFGYTELVRPDQDAEELLRQAELALFRNRDAGTPDIWTAYSGDLEEETRQRVQITRELREALNQDEFELHFQPKVDLATGRLTACEALIRWHHPERGLQSPGTFIPIAEQSQLIGPIGDWAIREACRRIHEWREAGLDIVPVAVNVSLVQFMVGDLTSTLRDALDAYEVPPGALSLEITESVFEQASTALRDQLERIHEIGVRLSLDDFGTGYSSLLYLQRYPFDEIKIDQGFVFELLDDPYSHQVVTLIMGLAEALGVDIIAEGVENPDTRDALCALGCRRGQGYYYSMPLAPEDFRWLLERQSPLPLVGLRPQTGTSG